MLFLLFLGIFLYGLDDVSVSTKRRQMENLETAVYRDIIHCYSVEGTYPPSLEYLKWYYGLTYNEDRYYIDYRSIGSNLMPDVTIIEK